MRILHIITSLRTGGAERLVAGLARQLRDGGDTVELLLFDGTPTPLSEEVAAAGIPVHSLSAGWRAMRNPLLGLRLLRFLRKNRYDVVHTHNTSCQLLAAAVSLVVPLTLVTTEHNTDNRRRRWKGYLPVDRWMYGRYARIVCVGAETRQALAAYLQVPALEARMQVVLNGIDVRLFSDARPAAWLSGREGCKILMVSAFRPQKDQPTLIRAMALLPEPYTLYLAGGSETDADRRHLAGCQRLVSEMKLEGRVHFLGVRPDVPALLAAADAVVLSTRYEGMSLSLIEGMASGKPFLASDVEGVHDLVAGAGLLFPCGDAVRLSELLVEVCGDPGRAAQVGARCRDRARQYDIARTAREYRAVYETMTTR